MVYTNTTSVGRALLESFDTPFQLQNNHYQNRKPTLSSVYVASSNADYRQGRRFSDRRQLGPIRQPFWRHQPSVRFLFHFKTINSNSLHDTFHQAVQLALLQSAYRLFSPTSSLTFPSNSCYQNKNYTSTDTNK